MKRPGAAFRKRRHECARRGGLAIACGRADLRCHGAADGRSRWRCSRSIVFGRACFSVDRHGPDVFVDERLPFGAVAEAGLQSMKS